MNFKMQEKESNLSFLERVCSSLVSSDEHAERVNGRIVKEYCR
ncbi:MAG: hypothetical protein V1847_01095 [Candidatus Diapherotrites archaeon]